jgi:N-acetylmuramoyl-L-alanine amidase
MLELYGVQSNTNWITQLQNVKEVKNIYFNQIEDDVIQVTIDLTHQQHWVIQLLIKTKHLL